MTAQLGLGLPVVGVGFLALSIGLYPAVVVFAVAIAVVGLGVAAAIARQRGIEGWPSASSIEAPQMPVERTEEGRAVGSRG